jgi:hypothetical protein
VHGEQHPLTPPGAKPVVVAWVGSQTGGDGPDEADLVIARDEIATLATAVDAAPLAARTLAVLLRAIATLPLDTEQGVEHGLALESTAYSLLQSGPEFTAWRNGTEPRLLRSDQPTVLTHRSGDTLTITLHRPDRHNAITAQLRDELHDALALALLDTSLRVELTGDGRSFCSGGDLDEFGARPDPVTAHMTRLVRSPARLIDRLRQRITVHTHGATLGGGLEMAAFANHVTAKPDTTFGLPELGLGLIPGAGGTVSLTRRIGRQHTALLALTRRQIDADTAVDWGLVNEIA